MNDNGDLKHKPFHKLKFKTIYKNKEERKPMKKTNRKVKIYVTPEIFDKIVEIYRRGGGISEIVQETGLSSASASKYMAKARARVANKEDEKNELAEVSRKLEAEVKVNETMRADITAMMEKHEMAIKNMASRHANEVKAYQEKLNQLTLENTKLQAKVEVMGDLLKGK